MGNTPPIDNPDDSTTGLIDRAMRLHQSGELAPASELYRRVLTMDPDHVDALHLLGVVTHLQGDDTGALRLVERAIRNNPSQSIFYNTLGLIQKNLGRLDDAEITLRRAIELDPGSPQTHHNLGTVLSRKGDLENAIGSHLKALELNPGYINAHLHLGDTYHLTNDLLRAAGCYMKVMELVPDHYPATIGLGRVLQANGQHENALEVFRKASQLTDHDDPVILCELADTLQSLSRLNEAVTTYENAVRVDDRSFRGWYGLGCARIKLDDYAAAIPDFHKAIRTDPTDPPNPGPIHNLGKAVFKLGDTDQAIERFTHADSLSPTGPSLQSIAIGIPGSPNANNQSILETRREWGQRNRPDNPRIKKWSRPDSARTGPLRIGYVSSFFQGRNWMKPVWGLINHHDRQKFEIHLFSDSPQSKIQGGYNPQPTDRFHDITQRSIPQVAALIEGNKIDILVDLNGYSRIPRLPLFMLKPAPIIVGWFNMYATTGLDCFDIIIGDPHVIPPDEEPFYTERVERVPGCYLAFEVTYPVPDIAPPPCQQNEGFTFGCLASQYKITPQVITAWSRILDSAPQSRLIIKNAGMKSEGNRRYMWDRFVEHGIDPDRIKLDGPSEHYEFLQKYDEIDLALDTFPYNGGTTTMESLWQGVPVLTFDGDRWGSRTSTTLMRNAGLGEYVAEDVEDYVRLGIELGNSSDARESLARLRDSMRSRLKESRACDTQGLAREMEGIYDKIWGQWVEDRV